VRRLEKARSRKGERGVRFEDLAGAARFGEQPVPQSIILASTTSVENSRPARAHPSGVH
jgi:hypothetical protein